MPGPCGEDACSWAIVGDSVALCALQLGEVAGEEPTVRGEERVGCSQGVGSDEEVGDYPLSGPAGRAVPLLSKPRFMGDRGIDGGQCRPYIAQRVVQGRPVRERGKRARHTPRRTRLRRPCRRPSEAMCAIGSGAANR